MIMHMRRVIKIIAILTKEIMKLLKILVKEEEKKDFKEINNPHRFL